MRGVYQMKLVINDRLKGNTKGYHFEYVTEEGDN